MFSEALKNARHAKGATQEEVARAIDAPLVTYLRWERGKATPRLRSYQKLQSFFGSLLSDIESLPTPGIHPEVQAREVG